MPKNQTLSPSLPAYPQPGEALALAHAPLLGRYSVSSAVEIPPFKGISNFKDIKTQLVTSNDIEELNEILNDLHQNSENFEFAIS